MITSIIEVIIYILINAATDGGALNPLGGAISYNNQQTNYGYNTEKQYHQSKTTIKALPFIGRHTLYQHWISYMANV
ncbi:MAG: hypothetical protein KA369_05880 [Spirochaetes bacterium]|nr:hypothetical protein [Spirochaetota bacterium]